MSEQISIHEFAKLDLRIGEVLTCERVPDTDKLFQLKVSLGSEERQIVAGMAVHYEPETVVGKQIVLVCNLKPAVIRGIKSEGMLLAAQDGEAVVFITPERKVSNGSKVS